MIKRDEKAVEGVWIRVKIFRYLSTFSCNNNDNDPSPSMCPERVNLDSQIFAHEP